MSLWTIQKRTGKSTPRLRPAQYYQQEHQQRRLIFARSKYFQKKAGLSGPLIPLAKTTPTYGETWPSRPPNQEVEHRASTIGSGQDHGSNSREQ